MLDKDSTELKQKPGFASSLFKWTGEFSNQETEKAPSMSVFYPHLD